MQPPTVTCLDPRGDAVLDGSAVGAPVGQPGAYGFTEGPCWVPARSAWVFSDIPRSTQYVWSSESGVECFRAPSNKANGNFLDSEGRLLTCEHETRVATRTDFASGKRDIIAGSFEGLPLNSPNDIIQSHRTGLIYFTDPNYGSIPRMGHGKPSEQAKNNVYCLDPSSGELSTIVDDFVRPNGLALNSPEETKMYIADSGASVPNGPFDASLPHHVRVFNLSEDGKVVSGGDIFCTVDDGNGVPDGVRCDSLGNVWVCVRSGVDVYSPDGKKIARVNSSEQCANAAFGGPSGSDLLLTCSSSVWLLKTKVRGGGDVRDARV